MLLKSPESFPTPKTIATLLIFFTSAVAFSVDLNDSLTYIWPLPAQFTSGEDTLSVDPQLSLSVSGNGGGSRIVKEGFERYKAIIFKHNVNGVSRYHSLFDRFRRRRSGYDIEKLTIVVHSDSEDVGLPSFFFSIVCLVEMLTYWCFLFVCLQLQLGVDESYTLSVAKNDGRSIVRGAMIEVKLSNFDFTFFLFMCM